VKLLTPTEVSGRLSLSVRTVQAMMRDGRVLPMKIKGICGTNAHGKRSKCVVWRLVGPVLVLRFSARRRRLFARLFVA